MADGRTNFIDFRERAPERTRDMYRQGRPAHPRLALSLRAAGIPGTVRGFELAHRRYGKANWADLVSPAVKLAQQGFPITYGLANSLKKSKPPSSPTPGASSNATASSMNPANASSNPNSAPCSNDSRRSAPATSTKAKPPANSSPASEMGGLFTLNDLKNYQAAERAPLDRRLPRLSVLTAPPSSGGIGILQMLGVLEPTAYASSGARLPPRPSITPPKPCAASTPTAPNISAIPTSVTVPTKKLLDPRYLTKLRESVNPDAATNSDQVKPGNCSPPTNLAETTHYSIVDADGDAVAVTYTLNGGYGSGATAPGLGILLKANEVDDFSVKPGGPQPARRHRGGEAQCHSARQAPAQLHDPHHRPQGRQNWRSSSAPRAAPASLRASSRFSRTSSTSACPSRTPSAFPRYHHQRRPSKLFLEPGFSPDTRRLLEQKGHQLETAASICEISAIQVRVLGLARRRRRPRVEGKAAVLVTRYPMNHALSTHFLVNQRLSNVWLDKIYDSRHPRRRNLLRQTALRLAQQSPGQRTGPLALRRPPQAPLPPLAHVQ
jgi:gamma-glutamyltranspeptidase/glutathione hydrolase